MKLLTWNIHGCVGTDGRFDPARTIDVFRHVDPDIAVLQEVDYRHEGRSILREMIEGLGQQVHHAPAMGGDDAWYGQSLLCRHPVSTFSVHDISVPRYEPRKLMAANIVTPFGDLLALATHLGLKRKERRKQIEQISEVSRRYDLENQILVGDLNEWLPTNRAFAGVFGNPAPLKSPMLRTFPSRFPALCLDRVLASRPRLIKDIRPVTVDPGASDHLPLVAEIQLPNE